jgi:hypothetical protein
LLVEEGNTDTDELDYKVESFWRSLEDRYTLHLDGELDEANGVKNTDDVVLNTTFGLSFPLLGNLETSAEILLEYDTGAVEGVEELDQTYKFRIGYTW